MATRQVRLREDHHQFVKDEAYALSGLVQNAIDEMIEGHRDPPSDTNRPTKGHALTRTSVSITDEHDDFIASHDFTFSVLVHQLIEERIEVEQAISELGGMDAGE